MSLKQELKEDIILVGISFFLIMLIFTAGVITINAREDNADYEIKKVDLNWKDGIEGIINQVKVEIDKIQKEGKYIVNIVPEVKGHILSQFPFSRTEKLQIIVSPSPKDKNGKKISNVAYFNFNEDIINDIINEKKLDPKIIVPVVNECGTLQIFTYSCTKYLLLLW